VSCLGPLITCDCRGCSPLCRAWKQVYNTEKETVCRRVRQGLWDKPCRWTTRQNGIDKSMQCMTLQQIIFLTLCVVCQVFVRQAEECQRLIVCRRTELMSTVHGGIRPHSLDDWNILLGLQTSGMLLYLLVSCRSPDTCCRCIGVIAVVEKSCFRCVLLVVETLALCCEFSVTVKLPACLISVLWFLVNIFKLLNFNCTLLH